MELRPYYDRPTAVISDYLARIDQKVRANYPHWGYENKGVWPKGEYGKGILRADQFSLLGTYGQWLIPSSGANGNPTHHLLLTPTAGLSAPLTSRPLKSSTTC